MGKRTRKAERKSGWRQWTVEEARRALREWRASGEPLEAFARRRGWTSQRLRWWRDRLSDWEEAGPAEAALAPVVVTGELLTRPAAVTLRAGDLVVEVADVGAVPASWLSTFLVGLRRPAA